MKLHIQLRTGPRAEDHQLEFLSSAAIRNVTGQLAFRLDGEKCEADCLEIASGVYSIIKNGQSYEAHVTTTSADGARINNRWTVSVGCRNYVIAVRDPRRLRHGSASTPLDGPQEILAPMPGRIVRILVEENQEVAQGAGLLVIEAMKMQNELCAPRPGRVEKIYVREATGVETGSKLIRLT